MEIVNTFFFPIEATRKNSPGPVLFSGSIAQFTNFMGLLIFPFKRGGRVFRHPQSGKAEVVTHGNLKVQKQATCDLKISFPVAVSL